MLVAPKHIVLAAGLLFRVPARTVPETSRRALDVVGAEDDRLRTDRADPQRERLGGVLDDDGEPARADPERGPGVLPDIDIGDRSGDAREERRGPVAHLQFLRRTARADADIAVGIDVDAAGGRARADAER
jgi:hypothetical protein